MKVNNRRRVKMSKRTSAIIVLCVALVLTLAVGYLGLNGTWLDSRGLYKLCLLYTSLSLVPTDQLRQNRNVLLIQQHGLDEGSVSYTHLLTWLYTPQPLNLFRIRYQLYTRKCCLVCH